MAASENLIVLYLNATKFPSIATKMYDTKEYQRTTKDVIK